MLIWYMCRVVIGYDEGTIMVKIGREEPVASMDNSLNFIVLSPYNFSTIIHAGNIKSVGADYEVCHPDFSIAHLFLYTAQYCLI